MLVRRTLFILFAAVAPLLAVVPAQPAQATVVTIRGGGIEGTGHSLVRS